jgi:homogentisate 1,2-dioxygenase
MLERMAVGTLPAKHHIALRDELGALRYEECLTRSGFDGPYTILYHTHRPQALRPTSTRHVYRAPGRLPREGLARRHYRSAEVSSHGPLLDARVPLLFNADIVLGVAKPTESDPVYFVNGDADEIIFVRSGRGTVRSVFGDLAFGAGYYVFLPKGMLYRFELDPSESGDFFFVECHGGVGLPKQWRNETGQLRMDAPYCHRDFRRPEFNGPVDEGIRDVVIRRGGVYHGFAYDHSPLDVVGWDGTVYPWAFPILAFQPRVSSVHLPPTWHGTFAAEGALICSFVPRPLDFHPDAVPCPYPHSSVDVDEVLYYVSGNFTSRTGIGTGSLTHHPAGLPHGPQPGRYEASIGTERTDEVAVMLDCYAPLHATAAARDVEDAAYEASFSSG